MLEFAEFGACFEEDLEDGESMKRSEISSQSQGGEKKELLRELFFLPCLHMGLSPGCS